MGEELTLPTEKEVASVGSRDSDGAGTKVQKKL